jgi:Flp pilus assembly protein TadG
MFAKIRTKLALHRKPLFRVTTVRRLARQEDGSTAVEFGLLGLPFFGLMFAIIETALAFFAGQTLETATADASRLIMTGQAQMQNFDVPKFKQAVCARIHGLFQCDKIKFQVVTATSFSAADFSKPLDAQGNVKPDTFSPGNAGDIVVVQVMYEWPIYVAQLVNLSTDKRLLMATAAFRNEPYQ